MSVYIGDVQTFAGVIADKPQVLKVIEESAEVFSAWERLRVFDSDEAKGRLVEEIADTIQACANLLAAIGVNDMRQPMQACYVRNVERGREYSSSDQLTDDSADAQQDSIRTRPINNGTCPIDKPQSVDANDANADSRDQLVVDIGLFVARYMPKEDAPKMFEAVCSFLDRQAAITERELCKWWRDKETKHDERIHRISELQRQCDELTAERDKWKSKCEHYSTHVDRLMESICDLARKQPYAFDPEAPYENAELVAKYIDELEEKAEQQSNLEWLYWYDDELAGYIDAYVADEGYGYVESLVNAREWLQSPHVDDCGQNADMSEKSADCVRNGGEMSDSREKLEAAVQTAAGYIYGRGFTNGLADAWNDDEVDTAANQIIQLLDRQAAITAIEVARERYDIERDLIAARDELQKALNAATGKWAKADAENRELQAENEALKARIESLRSKLSKMLDAASSIQHIGDLP